MQLLYLIIFSTITQHIYATYICFTIPNCQFESSKTSVTKQPNCCSIGALSYSTITAEKISENCTECGFVLNITIQPSQPYYTSEILYTPSGGQLISTFPVDIHTLFTPLISNVTLPTSLPYPLESLLTILYIEGNGEAIEYSRISETAGTLHGGVIDRSTFQGTGIPSGKFIPIVRSGSYDGTVVIQAEYLLATMQIEVSFSFVILKCLECENGGYPNEACTQCVCPLGYVGKLCQDIFNSSNTFCTNNTCQNNGTCNVITDDIIQCDCNTGFNGSFCQIDVNECLTETENCPVFSKCLNSYGDFSCICNQGYTGDNCDMDIDECQVVFCAHHSTCQNHAGGFKCVCNIGYTGVNCDTRISSCHHGNCSVNTSICIDNLYDNVNYTCICKPGFKGELCTFDIDECQSETKPCLSGETCVNTFGSFSCNCEIENCGISSENPGLNVTVSLGITLILLIIIVGIGAMTFWVTFLAYRYLKAVRVNAKYVMVQKLEKERLHRGIDKGKARNLKVNPKKKYKQKDDIEMTSVLAINYNAVSNDLTTESTF